MGTGYLKVATTTAGGDLPVQANIIVSLESEVLHDIHTNKSGITKKLPLDAPPKEHALDPDYTGIPYSTYSVKAVADGFATRVIHGVRIFDTITSILPVSMSIDWEEDIYIPAHALVEPVNKTITEPYLVDDVAIPAFANINETTSVPFVDYIQNIASQVIYPTWPPAAIEANIYAIVSLALNKIDQIYIDHGQVYDNVAQIVGNIFNRYVKREEDAAPFLSIYSDGKVFTCPGLWQWGSAALAAREYDALKILRHYYPADVEIVETNNIEDMEYFPGYNLQEGMSGQHVMFIQNKLNAIRINFPEIPIIDPVDGNFGSDTTAAVMAFQAIFELEHDPPTGVVSRNTWYRISIFDWDHHDNVSLEKELPSKEHVNNEHLMTMYLLSQIYSRHAGNYI